MSQSSPLYDSLQRAISRRAQEGITIFSLNEPPPSYAPDFWSNNYLSLSADHTVRDAFLRRVREAAPNRLLGSTGSRLATGNSAELNSLEKAFELFFGAPSAFLFNSGFSTNVAFLSTIPQNDDVIIYDELVHSSFREGIRLSSRISYRFAHNSLASLETCLLHVLQKHRQITEGASTVFIVLESLYSMGGDYCPLTEIVDLVETLVPAGHAHIVVDEAHTSGVCGPNGTGYVSLLGLDDRVHTKIHTLGKAWGIRGAVMLTSPIVREYLINFAMSVMATTAIPYTDIYALEACLGVMLSAKGEELRQVLHHRSRYAHQQLAAALKNVPEMILAVDLRPESSDHNLCSQIIPVFSTRVKSLAEYLLQRGHAVSPLTYPLVQRPRIRVTIHAMNTEKDINSLICELLAWAEKQECVFTHKESADRTSRALEAGELHTKTGAKL